MTKPQMSKRIREFRIQGNKNKKFAKFIKRQNNIAKNSPKPSI